MVDVAMKRATLVPGAPVEVPRDVTAPVAVQVAEMSPADPMSVLVKTVDRFGSLVEALIGGETSHSKGPRGVVVLALVVAMGSGMFFGVLGAIGAVWVHDSETRGRLGTAMAEQDEAIRSMSDAMEDQAKDQAALMEVVEGLLDEHEGLAEWLQVALEAGFAGKPIPRMGSSVPKLRRKMPP